MSTLLYIQASPLPTRSYSTSVADAFVDAYTSIHPKDTIIRKNLYETDLPSFDGPRLTAKYAILHGQTHTDKERAAWDLVEQLIKEFISADKYVMAVPMWNFGIPYRLKHYLDLIIQPSYTFSYSPQSGYQGLVTGKPIFLVYARGGEYPTGSPAGAMDFQKPYMEHILGFIGFTHIQSLVIEPTLMAGPEAAAKKTEEACATARRMAAHF